MNRFVRNIQGLDLLSLFSICVDVKVAVTFRVGCKLCYHSCIGLQIEKSHSRTHHQYTNTKCTINISISRDMHNANPQHNRMYTGIECRLPRIHHTFCSGCWEDREAYCIIWTFVHFITVDGIAWHPYEYWNKT